MKGQQDKNKPTTREDFQCLFFFVFFFLQKELWCCQLLIKGLFLLLRKSMNREKVKFRQSTKYCKLKKNVFTDAPKLVRMFSLSTSMQYKYCFYPLRKADMLTPHLFCPLTPSILSTPIVHGSMNCRSRAEV